jgi:hypothetical protein
MNMKRWLLAVGLGIAGVATAAGVVGGAGAIPTTTLENRPPTPTIRGGSPISLHNPTPSS